MQPEAPYDPHENRYKYITNPLTNFDTFSHVVKACMGTGVLVLPDGYKRAGLLNGFISTFIVGVFSTYLLHLLIKGQYELCKKRRVGLLSYTESMGVACEVGPERLRPHNTVVMGITDFVLILHQVLTCCTYVVFVGTNLKYVMNVYTPTIVPLYVYMLALAIPFGALLLVRNLKLLAPFSLVANIITVVTFGFVFYYICSNLKEKFVDRPQFQGILQYPLYFGTVVFALQSVPTIILIENNMRTPKDMLKTFGPLNLAFALLTVVYNAVGTMGYWKFGDNVKPSITQNFPVVEKTAQVIILSYCLVIYVSYAINAHVPLNIVLTKYTERIEEREDKEKILNRMDYLLRVIFVIVTFVLGTTIPLLGLIVSLIGSVCLSALGIIFPAFIDICAHWEEEKTTPKTFQFWKDILIMLIGLIAMLSGTYSSIREIVEELATGPAIHKRSLFIQI